MKRFFVNERLFSIGDKYDIFDENGNVAYFAKQRIFAFGEQFDVYDANGNEVCYIRKRLFTFLPKYELYINDNLIATVSREFTLFIKRYIIESKEGDYEVEGDVFAWNFEITKDGSLVCHVHKNWTLFKDRYIVDVGDIDEVLAIGLAVIFDSIHHDSKGHHHRH